MRKIVVALCVLMPTGVCAETDSFWTSESFRKRTVQPNFRTPTRPTTVSVPKESLPKNEAIRETLPDTISFPGNVIVVFRSSQQYSAYRNGVLAYVGTTPLRGPVSTGTNDKYKTPLTDPAKGPHRIEYKQIDYESSTYPEPDGGAPMPYAMFFDRKNGFALHGGEIPRWRGEHFGVSHGCVRLLKSHAKILFEHFSDKSVRVIVVENVAALQRLWEVNTPPF